MSYHSGKGRIKESRNPDWYKSQGAKSPASPPDLEKLAFESTLDAAEKRMQELKLAPNDSRRDVLVQECRDLLYQAEQIKNANRCQPSGNDAMGEVTFRIPRKAGSGSISNKPEAKRALTTREKIILLEGSKLHGFVFPPWTSTPRSSEFELGTEESVYLDNPELLLSSAQKAIFAGWKRPTEAFPLPCLQQPALFPNSNPTMVGEGRVDLVQDVTADCSVVASLCAITARAERGHSKMISSIIHPFDRHLLEPELSPNGKYIFRMHFNGCFRKVTIDDRLPTSRNEQTLHVMDRNSPGLLWPALIEKAYLKVRGGYDFPGSNSGTDIWVLTSWIPEQIFLQRDDISPGGLWRRIFGAFNYGDVLITVGTGGLTQGEELGIGLVSNHDYAIIDLQEVEDRQLLLVKNPWAGGSTWKGSRRHNGEVKSVQDDQDKTMSKHERLGAGTFWMDLNDIFLNFESMYLNWNPDLFSFREDIHFNWEMPTPRMPCGSFRSNPQFQVRSENGGMTWLLLSRHFQEAEFPSGCPPKALPEASPKALPEGLSEGLPQGLPQGLSGGLSEGLPEGLPEDLPGGLSAISAISGTSPGFMCLYLFDNNGETVFLSDGACCRGVYVDSPNTLIKFDLLPAKAYTIVVSEQSLSRSKYNFTLSALSSNPLSISKARDRYSQWVRMRSAWTTLSSGGNASSPTYHLNPQFSVKVPAISDISLLLEGSDEDVPIHVKLLWGDNKLLSAIRSRDILGDSGEYRKGFAVADIRKVQPGIYTIICSTFERGQLGAFNLSIGTTSNCAVKQNPKPDAGLLCLVVPTAYFAPGGNRLLAPLVAQRITRVSMEIPWRSTLSKSSSGLGGSLLKLSIEHGQGPDKQVLLVSGEDEFLDYGYGIRTKEIDIHPGMSSRLGLWVVLERLQHLGLPAEEEVVVEIHSDSPLEVGAWRQKDE